MEAGSRIHKSLEEKNRILFHRNCFLVLQYFKLITSKIVLLQRAFEKNLELYVITVLLTGQALMTISSPEKPNKVSTVEKDIGEAAILPRMREQSVHQLNQAESVCLEQDGVGEGKATEPPLATKIGYDVQCEVANESDAADGLHMNHQNHVKEVNALKENSSTGDQTATSSGESSKFYSTTITCVKSVKVFLEAYRVCVA